MLTSLIGWFKSHPFSGGNFFGARGFTKVIEAPEDDPGGTVKASVVIDVLVSSDSAY